MMRRFRLLVATVLTAATATAHAAEVSGDFTVIDQAITGEPSSHGLTARYLPALRGERPFGDWTGDYEIAANLTGAVADSGGVRSDGADAEIHRLWLRWYDMDTEVRAGRQKLSFGPGKVLRALQWFDNLDPTDPTAFTLGVDALLMRRYLPDNQALWLWRTDAVPNGADAGWGGRYTRPVGTAEIGLAVHGGDTADRVGLEGFWDPSVGLWSELTWQRDRTTGNSLFEGVVGVDYTFPWNSGLYGALEAKAIRSDPAGADATALAAQLSWPLGLVDSLAWIALAGESSMTGTVTSHFIEWRRSLDRHLLSAALTITPDAAGDPTPGMRLVYSFSH